MAETKMPERKDQFSIDKLPSNSVSSKAPPEDRPRVQKVVKGKVKVKEKSFGRKFADSFFGEDVTDVKTYIIQDVLVPTIKATISDIVGGGVEMLLFGRTSSNRRGGYNRGGNYTVYSSAYSNQNNQTGRGQPRRNGGAYGIRDIVFTTRGEAEDVLDALLDTMRRYDGVVSVADLYDMVGETGAFTDNAWGWTDLGNASVRRVRDGYLLVLPKPVSIK